MAAMLIVACGIALAAGAHLAIDVAERRARKAYERLVGEEVAADPPDDVWKGVRSLVGGWGCLLTVLAFVRGVGVVAALAAGLYLVVGR